MQIPNAQKNDSPSQQCHLTLLGPTNVKAACKTLVKLTPDFEQFGSLVLQVLFFLIAGTCWREEN